jgi:hypothetical protein
MPHNIYNKFLLDKLKTPSDIADFCIKHPIFCSSYKEFVCKKVLMTVGYKTEKRFDNKHCQIYKEIKKFSPKSSVNNKNYLLINDFIKDLMVEKGITPILKEFLKFNGISLVNSLKAVSIRKNMIRRSSKTPSKIPEKKYQSFKLGSAKSTDKIYKSPERNHRSLKSTEKMQKSFNLD